MNDKGNMLSFLIIIKEKFTTTILYSELHSFNFNYAFNYFIKSILHVFPFAIPHSKKEISIVSFK